MDSIYFISQEGEDVEFKKEILNSCLAFTEEACGEGLVTESSLKTLQIFQKFQESHNYNPELVDCTIPIISQDLAQHCDKNSAEVLKDLDVEQLKNLLDIAEIFKCEMLRMPCLAAVQCQLFVGENKKEFIEKFKKENEIDEDFTQEEEDEIINENKLVLDEIMQTYDPTNPKYVPGKFEQGDDEDEDAEYLAEQLEQQAKLYGDSNGEEEKKN